MNAVAYSFNLTAIPYPALGNPLAYLEVWPTGQQPQHPVSTLNNPTGTYVANAAIVSAGNGGSITALASDNTDLAIDINGYFAAPGTGGLSLYPAAPCRVIDTRKIGNGQPFSGLLTSAGRCRRQRLRHSQHGRRLCLQRDGGAFAQSKLSDALAGWSESAGGFDVERRRWLDHVEHGHRPQHERKCRRLRGRRDPVNPGHLGLLRAGSIRPGQIAAMPSLPGK